jgi:antitoxin (DNA-binding transcriptional repressor) of toxin-antitoxin stability system
MSRTGSTIGVRELRASAATAIRRAGAGERMVVTVDGRPVAQLGPVAAEAGAVTVDDLVAAGLLVPPRRGGTPRPTDPLPAWAGARLDRLLRELRG